jgi:hypothetical protein
MAAEASSGRISLKLVVLLFVIALFLVGGVAAYLFRTNSRQEFNGFAGKVEGYSQKETDFLLEALNLEKKYSDEFAAIKQKASVVKNRAHLVAAKKAQEEYYKKQTEEYLPLVGEDVAAVEQFLDRRSQLWLWGDEKKFLEYIDSVASSAKTAKTAFEDIVGRENLIARAGLSLATDSVEFFYFLEGYADPSTWGARLKPFKKYTQGYKFEGEDQIKTLYPKFYKALQSYKTLFAKNYEMCTALLAGNYSKVYQLSSEISKISAGIKESDLDIDWNALSRPFYRAMLDAQLAGLSAANLYKEKGLGAVSLGTRRLAAWALVWGSHLYALDHKDKYPDAATVSALVAALEKGDLLPSGFSFDQESFSCLFKEVSYKLSFTDEITGEQISVSSVN